jgi:hypothetical protein
MGAVNDSDQEASFNNWHDTLLDLWAPGVAIYSSTGGSDQSYASWNGTSMATPHLAGAFALLKQKRSAGTVDELYTALHDTGVSVTTGCGTGVSKPRIQVDSALDAISPTAVELEGFSARQRDGYIDVTWTTATEVDNIGFNLLRTESSLADYLKINAALIRAEGSALQGSAYTFRDNDVRPGHTYFYKLEDIDRDGTSTFHGPVSATVGSITLIAPENKAKLAAGIAPGFQWESIPFDRFKVQFSKRADFKSKMVTLPTKKTSGKAGWLRDLSCTPTKAEWKSIEGLAGSTGVVYWRVLGKDAAGSQYTSYPAKLFIGGRPLLQPEVAEFDF